VRLNEIDPLHDRRWIDLTERCHHSSLFHTPRWLEALRRTYGYEPVVFTDAGPGEPLRNALLFCRVNSWLTGRRLVSLPFSDHCEPLIEAPEALVSLLESLKSLVGRECRYVELRPLETALHVEGFETSSVFWSHSIDLQPELPVIFGRLHKNHARRAIRKAARSGLTLEVGRSEALLAEFFTLHTMARHRHGVPVQPFSWFRNLAEYFGGQVTIYMSKHDGQPAATILTIAHKKALVFKYGGSNRAYNRYGGTPHLFWQAIKDAKEQGFTEFDLGRSDVDNQGLLAFKDHLGARRQTLSYYRYSVQSGSQRWVPAVAKTLYSLTPKNIQTRLGGRLYRHFG